MFFNTFAHAAPVPADKVPLLVADAAREYVLRWADSRGLAEPEFDIDVVRGSRPLAACSREVTVEAADTRQPSRMRFTAICAGDGARGGGWRYEFVVRAKVSARIVIAANEIGAGKIIADEDLLLERHDISAVADSVSNPQDVVGMSARRTVRVGEVLRTGALTAPVLVKRGDLVTIVATRDQVTVSMAGEAMDAGAKGSQVRVRNASGNIIRTRVTGPGEVQPADMAPARQ
ncbi:flagellar biosynthesis protein FlgA [Duganella sp. Leaf126]|uniref:flagellar basal body P-ring formation chaperone FlgA n=1 Tax=Duganella sp. Leaf126 TaxID=1736266 RepID=UPI0006FF54AB|nr:flagellar basal body P-ring formation chaperone FlgA [Duganella sp. Leaf126]KQQ36126.1 flagellar biosynthesis protein FlgA [Duganella sp. Leaf126]